jgi:hypothetical protein
MHRPPEIPPPVADEMVAALFADSKPTGFDTVLRPFYADGALLAALDRYVETTFAASFPEVVICAPTDAAAAEAETLLSDREVTVRRGDFLTEGVELPDCEYVLSAPPRVSWDELSRERRREYASLSSRIRPDDATVEEAVLYIERALQFLTADGRGVFLAETGLKSDTATAAFRSELVPLLGDVERVDAEAHDALDDDHMIAVVTSADSPTFDVDSRTHRAPPARVESDLLADVAPAATAEAAEVMTSRSALRVYGADDGAGFVYMDMFHEDFDASLVYRNPEEMAGLVGYVSRTDLRVTEQTTIDEHARPIESSRCVAPSASIARVIEALEKHRFGFVGTPDAPAGLITRYDLNRLPVYRYLYECFSMFEIGLRNRIRTEAPDWHERTDVHVPDRGTADVVPDRLANAQLSDLVSVVDQMGLDDDLVSDEAESSLEALVALRNAVAHYSPLVHVMSDANTSDDIERGAGQLAAEHRLLSTVLQRLEPGRNKR